MEEFDVRPDELVEFDVNPNELAEFDVDTSNVVANASATPEEEGPSDARKFYEGALAGVTSDFKDEIGAGFQYLAQVLTGANKDENGNAIPAADVYRMARDGNRRSEEQFKGGAYTGGQVFGGIGQTLMTGGAVNPIVSGAVSGIGASEADLTKGEVGGLAGDAAIGGAVGKIGSVIGDKLGKSVVGPAMGWLAKRTADIADDASNKVFGKALSNLRKAQGAWGTPQANMGRAVDFMDDQVAKGRIPKEVIDDDLYEKKVTEFVQEQAPKKIDEILGYSKPNAPKDSEIEAFADQVRKSWDSDAIDNTVGGVTKKIYGATKKELNKIPFVEPVVDGAEWMAKKVFNPGTTERFFKKATEILKTDPQALGEYGKAIAQASNPAVLDYILSMSDGNWRKIKEKVLGDESDDERESNP